MANITHYGAAFFDPLREATFASARAVVPLLLKLIPAKNVIDVGCGDGTWLSIFTELGVTDIVGVDGDYIDSQLLHIPQRSFIPHDLCLPFKSDRTFDLVISLEVAEHLPPQCASDFVKSLIGLGPIIAFSAAIPGQGGTSHLNEQFPRYWAELFAMHNFFAVDCIRPQIWENSDVSFWYAQNMLLFMSEAALDSRPDLQRYRPSNGYPLTLIHPTLYDQEPTLPNALRQVIRSGKRSVRIRVERLKKLRAAQGTTKSKG